MPTVNNPKRPWVKARPAQPQQGRSRANRDVYGSNRWRKLSEQYRQANPLCVHCKQQGRLTESKVVDHIVPINQGADPWDESNYCSLCIKCHAKKSQSERV